MPLAIDNKPCESCPYRTATPSGVWDASEYEKLPLFDGPLIEQSPAIFLCHNGESAHGESPKLCRGWTDCHGGENLLALRLRSFGEELPEGAFVPSGVPVHPSGAAACEHGKKDIDDPSPAARKMMDHLMRKHPRTREGKSK